MKGGSQRGDELRQAPLEGRKGGRAERLPRAYLMASRMLSDMVFAGPGGFHIFSMMRGGSTPNPTRTVQPPTEVKLTEKARAPKPRTQPR